MWVAVTTTLSNSKIGVALTPPPPPSQTLAETGWWPDQHRFSFTQARALLLWDVLGCCEMCWTSHRSNAPAWVKENGDDPAISQWHPEPGLGGGGGGERHSNFAVRQSTNVSKHENCDSFHSSLKIPYVGKATRHKARKLFMSHQVLVVTRRSPFEVKCCDSHSVLLSIFENCLCGRRFTGSHPPLSHNTRFSLDQSHLVVFFFRVLLNLSFWKVAFHWIPCLAANLGAGHPPASPIWIKDISQNTCLWKACGASIRSVSTS